MSAQKKDHTLLSVYENASGLEELKKTFGPVYTEYRRRWDAAGAKQEYFRVPVHLDLDLNNACNMRCLNCNAVTVSSGRRFDVDEELLTKRLTEAVPLGIHAVNFGNCSEPLLASEGLFRLMSRVKALGVIDIFVHTNGLLMSEKITEQIFDSGVTRLCVSLDATTEETSDKIGRKGYKHVVDHIHRFLDMRAARKTALPLLRVSFCPNGMNCHEIKDFENLWSGKADLVEIQSFYDMHRLADRQGPLVKSACRDCPDPWRRLVIWPNNSYGACCQHYAFEPGMRLNLGFLKDRSIEDVWGSGPMNQIRNSIKNGAFGKECLECLDNRFFVREDIA